MSETLENAIRAKEKELLSLCKVMEKIKLQFVDETVSFAAEWYEKASKQYVTKYSDITLTLSMEKLTDLKKKVKLLKQEAKVFVEKALSEKNIWWHENPDLHASLSQYDLLGNKQVGSKYPVVVDRAVRFALGELGVILEEFGYNIATSVSFKPYQEFWFYSEQGQKAKFHPYFPHSLDWSEGMQETIRKYSEVFRKSISLLGEIQAIKEEMKRKQILDLWDEADK
jgi:hypothetical protein